MKRVSSLETHAFNHFALLAGWHAQYIESSWSVEVLAVAVVLPGEESDKPSFQAINFLVPLTSITSLLNFIFSRHLNLVSSISRISSFGNHRIDLSALITLSS